MQGGWGVGGGEVVVGKLHVTRSARASAVTLCVVVSLSLW